MELVKLRPLHKSRCKYVFTLRRPMILHTTIPYFAYEDPNPSMISAMFDKSFEL